jgi:hypothetical protein
LRSWMKTLAMFLCGSVLFMDLHAYAQSPNFSQFLKQSLLEEKSRNSISSERLDSQINTGDFLLSLPKELGRMDQQYLPRKELPIILIQDAHGQLDAQKKIEKILVYLEEAYGYRHLFLEGSMPGEISPDLLKFFQSDSLNHKVREELFVEGKIGGAGRYFHTNTENVKAFGLEDRELYFTNLLSYRRVYSRMVFASKFLEAFKLQLTTAGSKYLNTELQKFMGEWLSFQDRQTDILRHIDHLQKNAKQYLRLDLNKPISQKDYPQLVRLFQVKKIEREIAEVGFQAKAEEEKEQILNWLRETSLKEANIDFFKMLVMAGVDHRNDTIPENTRQILELFYDAARVHGFRWERYPNLSLLFTKMTLHQEIESLELFEEIQRVTDQILSKVVQNEKEEQIISLYRDYLALNKLFQLELSREDFLSLNDRLSEFSPKAISLRLEGLVEEAVSAMEGLSVLEETFDEAVKFYQLAIAREEKILSSMSEVIVREGNVPAVIVAGGFHADGFTEFWKKNEMPFVTVMPHIQTLESKDNYVDQMMLKQKKSASFSRVVNTMVDRIPIQEMGLRDAQFHRLEMHRIFEGTVEGWENQNTGRGMELHGLEAFIPLTEDVRSELRSPQSQGFPAHDLARVKALMYDIKQRHGTESFPYEKFGNDFDAMVRAAELGGDKTTLLDMSDQLPSGREDTMSHAAPDLKRILGIVKNAQDWSLIGSDERIDIETQSGYHSQSALRFLSDLRPTKKGVEDYALVETRKRGEDTGLRIWFWNIGSARQPQYVMHFEVVQGLKLKGASDAEVSEHGTRVRVYSKIENLQERVQALKEGVAINTQGPVYLHTTNRPIQINNPDQRKKFDYVGQDPHGNAVRLASGVGVLFYKNGYEVRDNGLGMSSDDFFERFLVQDDRQQKERRAVQKRKAEDIKLFSNRKVGERTTIEEAINGHQMVSQENPENPRVNVAEKLIIDYPVGTGYSSDESRIILNEDLTIQAVKNLIDQLTVQEGKVNEGIEDRFAKINALAIYIRKKQPLEERKKMGPNHPHQLLPYLKQKVQEYILSQDSDTEGKVGDQWIVPNAISDSGLPGGDGYRAFNHEKFIPIDNDLLSRPINVEGILNENARLLDPNERKIIMSGKDFFPEAKIYVASWEFEDKVNGVTTVLKDADGRPIILIDPKIFEQQKDSPYWFEQVFQMMAPEINAMVGAMNVPKQTVKKKAGILERLFSFLKTWQVMAVGIVLIGWLGYSIFQGMNSQSSYNQYEIVKNQEIDSTQETKYENSISKEQLKLMSGAFINYYERMNPRKKSVFPLEDFPGDHSESSWNMLHSESPFDMFKWDNENLLNNSEIKIQEFYQTEEGKQIIDTLLNEMSLQEKNTNIIFERVQQFNQSEEGRSLVDRIMRDLHKHDIFIEQLNEWSQQERSEREEILAKQQRVSREFESEGVPSGGASEQTQNILNGNADPLRGDRPIQIAPWNPFGGSSQTMSSRSDISTDTELGSLTAKILNFKREGKDTRELEREYRSLVAKRQANAGSFGIQIDNPVSGGSFGMEPVVTGVYSSVDSNGVWSLAEKLGKEVINPVIPPLNTEPIKIRMHGEAIGGREMILPQFASSVYRPGSLKVYHSDGEGRILSIQRGEGDARPMEVPSLNYSLNEGVLTLDRGGPVVIEYEVDYHDPRNLRYNSVLNSKAIPQAEIDDANLYFSDVLDPLRDKSFDEKVNGVLKFMAENAIYDIGATEATGALTIKGHRSLAHAMADSLGRLDNQESQPGEAIKKMRVVCKQACETDAVLLGALGIDTVVFSEALVESDGKVQLQGALHAQLGAIRADGSIARIEATQGLEQQTTPFQPEKEGIHFDLQIGPDSDYTPTPRGSSNSADRVFRIRVPILTQFVDWLAPAFEKVPPFIFDIGVLFIAASFFLGIAKFLYRFLIKNPYFYFKDRLRDELDGERHSPLYKYDAMEFKAPGMNQFNTAPLEQSDLSRGIGIFHGEDIEVTTGLNIKAEVVTGEATDTTMLNLYTRFNGGNEGTWSSSSSYDFEVVQTGELTAGGFEPDALTPVDKMAITFRGDFEWNQEVVLSVPLRYALVKDSIKVTLDVDDESGIPVEINSFSLLKGHRIKLNLTDEEYLSALSSDFYGSEQESKDRVMLNITYQVEEYSEVNSMNYQIQTSAFPYRELNDAEELLGNIEINGKPLKSYKDVPDIEKLKAVNQWMKEHAFIDRQATRETGAYRVNDSVAETWAGVAAETISRGEKLKVNERSAATIKAILLSYLGMPVALMSTLENRQPVHQHLYPEHQSVRLVLGFKGYDSGPSLRVPEGEEKVGEELTQESLQAKESFRGYRQQDIVEVVEKTHGAAFLGKGTNGRSEKKIWWIIDDVEENLYEYPISIWDVFKYVTLKWSSSIALQVAQSILQLLMFVPRTFYELGKSIISYVQYRNDLKKIDFVFKQLGVPTNDPVRKALQKIPWFVFKSKIGTPFSSSTRKIEFTFLESLQTYEDWELLRDLYQFHKKQRNSFVFLHTLLKTQHIENNRTYALSFQMSIPYLELDNLSQAAVDNLADIEETELYDPLLASLKKWFDRSWSMVSFYRPQGVKGGFNHFSAAYLYLDVLSELDADTRKVADDLIRMAMKEGKIKDLAKIFNVLKELFIAIKKSENNRYGKQGQILQRLEKFPNRFLNYVYSELKRKGNLKSSLEVSDYLVEKNKVVRMHYLHYFETQRENPELMKNWFPYPGRELLEYFLGYETLEYENDEDLENAVEKGLITRSKLASLFTPIIQEWFPQTDSVQRMNLAWLVDAAEELIKQDQKVVELEQVHDAMVIAFKKSIESYVLGRKPLINADGELLDLDFTSSSDARKKMRAFFDQCLGAAGCGMSEIASAMVENAPQKNLDVVIVLAALQETFKQIKPRTSKDLRVAIEMQRLGTNVAPRELVQNARDITRGVPKGSEDEVLRAFGGKREVRYRSYLQSFSASEAETLGLESGIVAWDTDVWDAHGMSANILFTKFYPPRASTKDLAGMINDILENKALSSEDKAAAVFMRFIKAEAQGNDALWKSVREIINGNKKGESTAKNILKTLNGFLTEEDENAGKFGVGNLTVYHFADEVVVRTGFHGKVFFARTRPVLDEKGHVIDVEYLEMKSFEDPEGYFEGTKIKLRKYVHSDNLTEVQFEDRYMRYLFAKQVGAVDPEETKIVVIEEPKFNEEVKVKSIQIHDERTPITSFKSVTTLTSQMKIPRITVDKLYIQDPGDDVELFKYVPGWAMDHLRSESINFEFVKGTPVTEARGELLYPTLFNRDVAAVTLQSLALSWRRGEISFPGLNGLSYQDFLTSPLIFTETIFRDFKIINDAQILNKGQQISHERWQYYEANDSAYAALMVHLNLSSDEKDSRSAFEIKKQYFFKFLPNSFFEDIYMKSEFLMHSWKGVSFEDFPELSTDAFTSEVTLHLLDQIAKKYAQNRLSLPGFPSLKEYLDEKRAVVQVNADILQDARNWRSHLSHESLNKYKNMEALFHFVISLPVTGSQSINDIKKQAIRERELERERQKAAAALAQEEQARARDANASVASNAEAKAPASDGASAIRKSDNLSQLVQRVSSQMDEQVLDRNSGHVVLASISKFLDRVTEVIENEAEGDRRSIFETKSIEWDLTGEDADLVDAFDDFLENQDENGNRIFDMIFKKIYWGAQQNAKEAAKSYVEDPRFSFFATLLSGNNNFKSLRSAIDRDEAYRESLTSIKNLIAQAKQVQKKLSFLHQRSELRKQADDTENELQEQRALKEVSFEAQLEVTRMLKGLVSSSPNSEYRSELQEKIFQEQTPVDIKLTASNGAELQSRIQSSTMPISLVMPIPVNFTIDEMKLLLEGVFASLAQGSQTHQVLLVIEGGSSEEVKSFKREFNKSFDRLSSEREIENGTRFHKSIKVLDAESFKTLASVYLQDRDIIFSAPTTSTYAYLNFDAVGRSFSRVVMDQFSNGKQVDLSDKELRKHYGSFIPASLEVALLEADAISERSRFLIQRNEQWFPGDASIFNRLNAFIQSMLQVKELIGSSA